MHICPYDEEEDIIADMEDLLPENNGNKPAIAEVCINQKAGVLPAPSAGTSSTPKTCVDLSPSTTSALSTNEVFGWTTPFSMPTVSS